MVHLVQGKQGNKLKKKFGKKIVVEDLDDLRAKFVKKHYGGYDKIWSKKILNGIKMLIIFMIL